MPKLFAHGVIEADDTVYQPGDTVPANLPGLDELREAGSVSPEAYVEPDPVPPEEVVIEGYLYKRGDKVEEGE